MTKEEIKSRMKHLARKFCRRNNVYKEFDGSVGKLIEKSYLSAYLLCLHESKNKISELEKKNATSKDLLLRFIKLVEFLNEGNVKEPIVAEAEKFLKEVDE